MNFGYLETIQFKKGNYLRKYVTSEAEVSSRKILGQIFNKIK